MEFIEQNYLNTTTMLTLNSNTTLANYLFNPDPYYNYVSSGLNDDTTSMSITITFSSTSPVSRISLKDINLKEFKIFYDGVTANTFAITGANTTTCDYTANSDTSLYFRCSTVQCSSITLDAKKTMIANQEKVIGLFVASDLLYSLAIIPSAQNYKPVLNQKQIVHTLSDGGTRIHNVRSKFSFGISLNYLQETDRDSLKSIYNRSNPFMFCPFGTTTSWDGILFESVWTGPFDFYEYSDNASSSGFSGKITLKETPN